MKKTLAILLVLTLSLGACASAFAEGTIAINLKTLSSEYWQNVKSGCDAAAAELGVTIDVQGAAAETEIAEQVGSSPSLGRPHVADAMVAKGYVADRQEAFDRFLHDGGPAYANRYSCPLRRGIELIRRAGGVPVIAHPWGRGRDKELTPAMLSELTMENRLEGVEVDHPDHDADTRARLRALASRLGLLTLGSSDHHGLGKVNNPLACETTDPDVYAELVRRIRARGGHL